MTTMRVHPRYRVLLIISSVLAVLTTGLAVAGLPSLQPEIPLWYTFTQPSQALTSKWWVLVIPLLSLLLNASILALALGSKRIDEFIVSMYGWSTILNQGILLLALLRLLLII